MKKSLIFSFSLIGQVGFTTAVPLVFFGLLGRYADHKLGTSPYLTLLGFALATVVIYFAIKKLVEKAIENFK